MAAPAASEEVHALLVQWNLQSYEAVLAELGLEGTSDLGFMEDSDVALLEMPTLAKRKVQAMLEWWREENAAGPLQKKGKLENASAKTFSFEPLGKVAEETSRFPGCPPRRLVPRGTNLLGGAIREQARQGAELEGADHPRQAPDTGQVQPCPFAPHRLDHKLAPEPRFPQHRLRLGEIGILLPKNQRQHRTLHIQKDLLPYALC